MKVILATMMVAMLLPVAGCGKKSDVVPPPGYRQPARVKAVPPAPATSPAGQQSETQAK